MRTTILSGGLLLATSCAAAPRPPAPLPLAPPPNWNLATGALPGRALAAGATTPLGVEGLVDGAPLQFAQIRFALLATCPSDGGERLVDSLALIVDPSESGSVLLPSSALEPARVWRGDAARELWDRLTPLAEHAFLPLAKLEEPLIAGFTHSFAVSADERVDDPRDFLRERTPATTRTRRFGVALDGIGAAGANVTFERGSAGFDGELGKLALPLAPLAGPLLIVVPTPFLGGHGAWCAAWLAFEEVAADSPAAATWHARANELLAQEQVRRAAASAPVLRANETLAAWEALPTDASGRTALVWQTAHLPDSLIADLAVVASDAELTRLLEQLAATRARGASPADGAALDALLEREAIAFLARLALEDELPPELASVAWRRTGAVGGFPSTLAEVAQTAGGWTALQARLIVENQLLLEESSAAIRVRAFDWLAARHAAPAGFDPLAPQAQRRAALAAAAEHGDE